MDERKHINLIYQYNDKWIGGTYYILNIIKALNRLPDNKKPFLTIFHDQFTPLTDLENINYPYIEYKSSNHKLNLLSAIVNKITGKDIFTVKLPGDSIINFYFRSFALSNSNISNYYCWIADLQDLYLPQYFKKEELKKRIAIYNRMVKENEPIIFSSNAALNDFNKFFPQNTNKKKVVSFVSLPNSNFEQISITDLKNKFNIQGDFFMVSNQFWKHKNHKVVLEAFAELFKSDTNFQLVLTGKEYDYRDPNYTNELKNYVKQNNLTDKILFLGFIDREEQLKLMSESIAIIQPSLFEGWSTVVEDAKLLNKRIICSDIPVHREQLPQSNLFFDPNDKHSLINIVNRVIRNEVSDTTNYNHETAIIKFAEEFVNIFD